MSQTTNDIETEAESIIEKYLLTSAIRCAKCGDIDHTTITHRGDQITADDLGISSIGEWETEMAEKSQWIHKHPVRANDALAKFRDEWPYAVQSIKQHILPA